MNCEDVKLRVRGRLDAEKIKLWLPPYVSSTSDNDANEPLMLLARTYAEDLKLSEDQVLSALKDLQTHSIERCKSNEHFRETGVAVLRISTPIEVDGTKHLNVQIKLSDPGSDLFGIISDKLSIEVKRLKVIHKGKVLKHHETLLSQNVKNGAQMLLIVLSGTPESIQKDADLYLEMQNTRNDAEILCDDLFAGDYMQLEDQSGNALKLPAKEKKALTVAMTLHERGRKAIKTENYSLALVVLLEADRHFSECNAEILKSVDNYALLNLDIAWCYLCLQSITHIPDAQHRLTVCENNFHRSYGSNLERLIALKGNCGNEKALFMRLHLLQGIVCYHQNKRNDAKKLLERAERELNSLKVDETSLNHLVEIGYTLSEARMGLRACDGNLQAAIELILKTRKQRVESRRKAREERENRVLGYCDDEKQYVQMSFVKILMDMGYPKMTAILALKKSNNHISNAVQIIQDQPESLNMMDLPSSVRNNNTNIDAGALQTLMEIGYDLPVAKKALKLTLNNLSSAIDILSNNTNVTEDNACPSSSVAESSQFEILENKAKKRKKDAVAAFERLSEGIDNQDDDYLDLDLKQEESFVEQYKKFFE